MKEYFISFSIAFFMTLLACFFNYFHQPLISILGGLPLAYAAYWRISKIDKVGLSVFGHSVAYSLSVPCLYVPICQTLRSTPSAALTLIACWLLAVVFAVVFYKMRHRLFI